MQTEVEQEKILDHASWCGKTSPELSAQTKEQTSEQSCKKRSVSSAKKSPLFLCLTKAGLWQDASTVRGGIGPSHGEYLTLSFGEYPSVGAESHLSQILEDSPHPKYSLSAKACQGIIRRAERRGKPLPDLLRTVLEKQAQGGGLSQPTYCIQGNCIDRADTAGCNGKGWTEDVSYTLNTVDRPAVCGFKSNMGAKAHGIGFEEGKAPTLSAGQHDASVCIAIENHPNDSRVKLSENNVVQSLTGRMGTGGGQHANDPQDKSLSEVYSSTCGYYMQVEKDKCSTLLARDYKQPQIVCYKKRS